MTVSARALSHVRPVEPLLFPEQEPESERMGQGGRHFEMCVALYQILRSVAGQENTVACDAFLYFDASDPRRKLAPDASVKLGIAQHAFDSWKTWEGGAPELAFEILSPSDTPERWTFEEKLERYRAVGVRELVTFHVDSRPDTRLRIWDRIDGDLVERVVENEQSPCITLGVNLVVGRIGEWASCLRVALDPEGTELILTPDEERDVAEQARGAAEQARGAAEQARDVAEAKLREAERRLAELEGRRP